MKVSAKQIQQERIAELKKIKTILLKIAECEKVEAVDKLRAIQLAVDIDKALNRTCYNPVPVQTPEKAD